jgi:hypothetical protein
VFRDRLGPFEEIAKDPVVQGFAVALLLAGASEAALGRLVEVIGPTVDAPPAGQ